MDGWLLLRVCVDFQVHPRPEIVLVQASRRKEEKDIERLSYGVTLFEELNLRDQLGPATVRGGKFSPLTLLCRFLLYIIRDRLEKPL